MEERADLYDAEGVAYDLGKMLGEAIKEKAPGWGFCLSLFTRGADGFVTYISNLDREDMIKALEELIGNLKKDPRGEFSRRQIKKMKKRRRMV